MKETMGQIIRRLRKERNLTQDELAEQLGVTFQAISKWENDTGMPDISHIIPLATVFNVSTDVLFGICGRNDVEEVNKIIEQAESKITHPVTRECIKQQYDELQKGLEKYPSNTVLLSQSLEAGISLAYPENDVFDADNGEAIYKECVRQANIVIKYGKNTTDILRAHMIMVLLHSAYGNFEAAEIHANEFPWRADMTIHNMKAYIAHFKKDYRSENKCYQNDLMYHFEAMLDDLVAIAISYHHLKCYQNTEYALMQALSIIDLICKDEEIVPCFHCRERGDIYFLLAMLYLDMDRTEDALSMIEKMAEYDSKVLPQFIPGKKLNNPLLRDVERNFYWTSGKHKEKLLLKLNNPSFKLLREDERFANIMKSVESL